MYKVELKGLQQVLANIEKYSKDLADGIDQDLSTAAESVAVMAKTKAPIGKTGALGEYIRADVSIRFQKTVTVYAPYAAYVEFGTGVKVFKTPEFNFTPEMKAYAMEFYVSGKGREPAHPYLFPSLEIEKVRLIARIKERLFGKTTRL